MRTADPRWLLAAVREGLVAVGPDREIEIEIDAEPGVLDAVLAALTPSPRPDELALVLDATSEQVDELLETLDDAGVFAASAGGGDALPENVISLADALVDAAQPGGRQASAVRAAVVTAEEVLMLPAGLDGAAQRRALRFFVAGIEPPLRQRAYCRVASAGVASSWGDRPGRGALERALETGRQHVTDVCVVNLASGLVEAVAADRLTELGCAAPHRLGPLTHVGAAAQPAPEDGRTHVCAARYALPNLRFPDPGDRIAGGRHPDPATAGLIARAEAAERFAGGDTAPHELKRARLDDLDAPAITPADLIRFNDRQLAGPTGLLAFDAEAEHLWVAGARSAGERSWVIADAVFYPFDDPALGGRLISASSSGTAAHSSVAKAREKAICELAERDAFMWTWVQRVSRERIDLNTLPPALAKRAGAVARSGYEVCLVNLTTDTVPVVLCALVSRDRLSVGISGALDPAEAITKATDEAVTFLASAAPRPEGRQALEEIATPLDHATWHQYPEQVERDRFLFGSTERIGFSDLAPPGDALELLGDRWHPVTVDLTSPETTPFSVVRVLVPGLIPVSFGYDREPLGNARLAEPKQTCDGRVLGRRLDLTRAEPVEPHPFA